MKLQNHYSRDIYRSREISDECFQNDFVHSIFNKEQIISPKFNPTYLKAPNPTAHQFTDQVAPFYEMCNFFFKVPDDYQ